MTQLHDAAAIGDVAALREALAAGADVDAKRTDQAGVSGTPLARVLHPMKTIPSKGGQHASRPAFRLAHHPQRPSSMGEIVHAALHDAAYLGLYTVCRLLLDAGADVSTLHNGVRDANTPLHYAVNRSRAKKRGALLLSRGAVDGPNVDRLVRSSYLQKVRAAGSFVLCAQHRAKLVAMLAPNDALVHLPPELVSVVITFWAPVGLH